MSQFPDPITLPDSVPKKRKERSHALFFATKLGVLIRLLIVAAECIGFLIYGSHALLTDAIASSLDIISSAFLAFFIFLAARPPDEDHPFGHGRYEPLAGMLLGFLLTGLGITLIFQQTFDLATFENEPPMDSYLWMIPAGAVFLLEISYRISRWIAKKEHSPALAADAVHFRIDALTSLFAAIALILAARFPLYSTFFDLMGAVLISCLMIVLGLMASRKNIHQLMDKAPPKEFFTMVKEAAIECEGVKETEKLKIQLFGPDAHVSIDVEVDPALSVDKAHKISQKVRASIQKRWPKVRDVQVHIEPYYPGDH